MEKSIPTIELETRTYKLTGITPLLGSQPANPDVRTAYIESKAPDPTAATEEENQLLARSQLDEKTLTVFLRDTDNDDAILLLDYVVLGYLKSAIDMLKAQNGVLAAGGKVDKYVFAAPRKLYITRDGEKIYDEDAVLERPLRARTMQGDRVALTASEQIMDPWEITVELTLLPNGGTKSSKAITWEVIEQALSLGRMKGLGQWRNGGYGRFLCERVK